MDNPTLSWSQLARRFDANPASVRSWCMRDTQAIMAVPETCDKLQRRREPFLGTSVEASLVHWIQSLVGHNVPVSGEFIQSKARSLAKAIYGEACTFEGTRGWLDLFNHRWGL
jgi:hypothetical protein